MKTRIGRSCLMLVIAVGAVFLSRQAEAKFDLIVPSLIEYPVGKSTVGFGGVSWGWIVPTTDEITQTDLETAVVTGSITGPPIAEQRINVFVVSPPLVPGVAVGRGNLSPAYAELLKPGEVPIDPPILSGSGFYSVGTSFPAGYTGTQTYTGSVTIDGYTATYSTTVIYSPEGSGGLDFAAQRISAIPEPTSLAFLSLGSLLIIRRRR